MKRSMVQLALRQRAAQMRHEPGVTEVSMVLRGAVVRRTYVVRNVPPLRFVGYIGRVRS